MFIFVFILLTLVIGWRYPGFLVSASFFGFTAGAIGVWPQSTIILVVLSIAMLALKFLARPLTLSVSAIDLLFFTFIGWCCLSATWQPNGSNAIATATAFAASTVSIYIICRLVGALGQLPDRIIEVAAGFCLLGIVLTPLAFGAGSFMNGRLFIGSSPPVGLSQPVPYIVVSALALLVSIKRHRFAVILLALLALASAVALAAGTGTRGALLAASAGAVTYILLSGNGRSRLIILTGLAIFGLVAFVILDQFTDLQRGLVERLFNFDSYGSTQDLSSMARYEHYRFAWYMFERHPFVGVGLGGYSSLSGYEYPHNLFLEVASETGSVGILLLFALVLAVVVKSRAFLRGEGKSQFALIVSMFVVAFVHQQVSFELAQAKGIFLVGIIGGLSPRTKAANK